MASNKAICSLIRKEENIKIYIELLDEFYFSFKDFVKSKKIIRISLDFFNDYLQFFLSKKNEQIKNNLESLIIDKIYSTPSFWYNLKHEIKDFKLKIFSLRCQLECLN